MQPYDTYPPMMNGFFTTQTAAAMLPVLFLIVALELIFKSFALWRAARMGMTGWFAALLVINSAGIFPLLFLVFTNAQYEAFNVFPPRSIVKKKRSTKA